MGGTGTLSGVASLTTGDGGYCALLTSGRVDCWGYNNGGGELGNGTITSSNVPVAVVGVGGTGTLSGVASLANGEYDRCAVLTSGGVDCWGYNLYGELGNGTTMTSGVPVAVVGVGGTGTLSGVLSVTSGNFDFCALLASGGVDCWGYNGDGDLGNGTTTNSDVPFAVVGVGGTGTLSGVASVTSGIHNFCALLASGGVDCWGYNGDGELGNGTTTNSDVPVAVVGVGGTGTLSGVARVTSAYYGYCALLHSGVVDCWGSNFYGDLGNGSTTNSDVPVAVEAPTDTVAFNSDGGAAVSSLSGPDGSTITLPSDTYPGYVFDGWFTAASGGTEVGGAGSSYTIPSGGITLYAQWTENTIETVGFVSDGGAPVASLSGPYGSAITLPSDTWPGHVLDGWFTARKGGVKIGLPGWAYTIPPGGSTLYARWAAIDTVAFNSDGGAAVPSISGPDGSPITLPSDT